MTRNAIASVLVVLVLAAIAAAQGGSPLSYATDIEPIFTKECGDCHSADNPKKGLDLSQGHGFAALLDRPSQMEPPAVLVKAGDQAGSYLWAKLSHSQAKGKGMPRTMFSDRKLGEAELTIVGRWIGEGAKP